MFYSRIEKGKCEREDSESSVELIGMTSSPRLARFDYEHLEIYNFNNHDSIMPLWIDKRHTKYTYPFSLTASSPRQPDTPPLAYCCDSSASPWTRDSSS